MHQSYNGRYIVSVSKGLIVCDDGTFIQIYDVSEHYPSSCFYSEHSLSEIVLCLRLQVKPTQLGQSIEPSPNSGLALSIGLNLIGFT
jgi:hypothetical protein